jgi:hypothetical protein
MRRFLIAFSLLLITGSLIFLCLFINIETRRFAVIDRNARTIQLHVSGFIASPLTPEGPFPRWKHDVKVFIRSGRDIPTTGRHEFQAGSDFSSQYEQVESGILVVDLDLKRIEVKVVYKTSYSWTRVRGLFPIEEGVK